jgi:hypothetical protein
MTKVKDELYLNGLILSKLTYYAIGHLTELKECTFQPDIMKTKDYRVIEEAKQ